MIRRICLALVFCAGFTANAATQNAPTVVILVRHAEKAIAPASDPPLTDAGLARARALAVLLSDANVDAVIATPTVRTRETARPTAEAHGIAIETVAFAPVAVHAKAVAEAVMKHAGKTVLVVAHSNTVAAIVAALGGPKMADLCDSQYSMLIALVLDGHTVRVIRSSYGIATPDTPEACPATGGSVRPASGADYLLYKEFSEWTL